MSSMLLKLFTQGYQRTMLNQYIKIYGIKSPKRIDSVIPNLTQNLVQSTQSFLDGLVSLDEEFVQGTATNALQKKLLPEMAKLKANKTFMKMVNWNTQEDKPRQDDSSDIKSTFRFHISPYVIFGQTMSQRNTMQNPWKGSIPLFSTNRFYVALPDKSFSLKDFMNNQVFGFNCYINSKGIQVGQGSQKTFYPPKEMIVTFETDAEDQQFYVSDLNWIMKTSV